MGWKLITLGIVVLAIIIYVLVELWRDPSNTQDDKQKGTAVIIGAIIVIGLLVLGAIKWTQAVASGLT